MNRSNLLFHSFGEMNNSLPAPADVQVTHTAPTQRLVLYAPLAILLGVWGTLYSSSLSLLLLHCWFELFRGLTVPDPRSNNVQAMQTMPALRPALLAPRFASLGHWESEGGVWGVCVWCLMWQQLVPVDIESMLIKKFKKVQKEQLVLLSLH